jgi:hypothetical protein
MILFNPQKLGMRLVSILYIHIFWKELPFLAPETVIERIEVFLR